MEDVTRLLIRVSTKGQRTIREGGRSASARFTAVQVEQSGPAAASQWSITS
jgi:hypothetical protein